MSNAFVLLFQDQDGFRSEAFVSKDTLVARLLQLIKKEMGKSFDQIDIGRARDHTEEFVFDLDAMLHHKPDSHHESNWDSSERLRYAEGPLYNK